uniref:Predicted protein n=2 Tax=Hordeum vulgare subsp. vulgare TaxID=112509 RepID=F2DFG9_HORVV|nr:predicted protein [Hordeum vulgare subsp. vulgare]
MPMPRREQGPGTRRSDIPSCRTLWTEAKRILESLVIKDKQVHERLLVRTSTPLLHLQPQLLYILDQLLELTYAN